jgi:hypothetical protein
LATDSWQKPVNSAICSVLDILQKAYLNKTINNTTLKSDSRENIIYFPGYRFYS